MSAEAKKKIQELAWDRFPSQELWINDNNHFWGFDKREGVVYCVEGFYHDGNVVSDITIVRPSSPSRFVEECIKLKERQGYECFASQLFV